MKEENSRRARFSRQGAAQHLLARRATCQGTLCDLPYPAKRGPRSSKGGRGPDYDQSFSKKAALALYYSTRGTQETFRECPAAVMVEICGRNIETLA